MDVQTSTRDVVLEAFRDLVVEEGERSATVAATAARAGVSKGGLFYYFPTRDALVDALIGSLSDLNAVHCERVRTAEEGPIAYFLRDAVRLGTPLDLALSAVTRLDQSGKHPAARPALERVVREWRQTLEEVLADPPLARIVEVLGDGLFFNSSLAGSSGAVVAPRLTPFELEAMIATIEKLR
ncbi:TetR/AcrR family transcriptional regulator [Rathayibacter caricis]|uniref:TetR/AcrR family transcriptional regulator n=1 Tax=Rathayibacter caricis TaxID=110936 RepID=UPI001FB31255|nr:TetR/AcrR family transcriptional regulator [Rathayibacter caricis]MCJ1695959.1 TetR/AcrR family transcriptional regulator [Rathayibacter caricis]